MKTEKEEWEGGNERERRMEEGENKERNKR